MSHSAPVYVISSTFHENFLHEMLPWKFSPMKVSHYIMINVHVLYTLFAVLINGGGHMGSSYKTWVIITERKD